MKDYLSYENNRNHHNKALFERILKEVHGQDCEILVVHHITFRKHGEDDGNEIPSADTLIFDHDIMEALFGPTYLDVITDLAVLPAEKREAHLLGLLDSRPLQLPQRAHSWDFEYDY